MHDHHHALESRWPAVQLDQLDDQLDDRERQFRDDGQRGARAPRNTQSSSATCFQSFAGTTLARPPRAIMFADEISSPDPQQLDPPQLSSSHEDGDGQDAERKIRVGLVGLGFGAEFAPIWEAHPKGSLRAVCDTDETKLRTVGEACPGAKQYSNYADLLSDGAIDMVHICTPINLHFDQTIDALKHGKHVLCAVPMATTTDQCMEICRLARETGLCYMMAETAVYTREFLHLQKLKSDNVLGDIQYLKASHMQDMTGWPEYWKSMAPMQYATHVASPVLGVVDGRAEYVTCFGSGSVCQEIQEKSGYPHSECIKLRFLCSLHRVKSLIQLVSLGCSGADVSNQDIC